MSSIMHKVSEALHKADDKFSVTNGDPVQEDLDRKASGENTAAQVAVAQQEQEHKYSREGMHDAQAHHDKPVMYHGRAVPDPNAFDAKAAAQHPTVRRHPVSDTYTRPNENERLEDEAVRVGNVAGDDTTL